MASIDPAQEASASPDVCVPADLAEALRAQGALGEQAVRWLLDAATVLSSPDRYAAPNELAQACCRGAVDSILKLAGEGFEGLESARREVIEQARQLVRTRQGEDPVDASALGALDGAMRALEAEEENPGGFRVRQVDHLVKGRTGSQMGAAERAAALASWNTFYRRASEVLHGGSSTGTSGRIVFGEVLDMCGQLFLALSDRAPRLLELVAVEEPTEEMAREIARWTDPLASRFFFREAASPRWLELLDRVQPARLLPDPGVWAALPYLHRLLTTAPKAVLAWLGTHLEEATARGAAPTAGLLAEAGPPGWPLVVRAARSKPSAHMLSILAVALFRVAMAERTAAWLNAAEAVLDDRAFTEANAWEAGELLTALTATAHPDKVMRPAGDGLGRTCRFALAGVVSRTLGSSPLPLELELGMANDLRDASQVRSRHPGTFPLQAARAWLDLARTDAELGVALADRTGPLCTKLPAGPVRARLLAVHLLESHPMDAAEPDCRQQQQVEAWWDLALLVAGWLLRAPSPRADVAGFLGLLHRECPADTRRVLTVALQIGLGPVPSQVEITRWRRDYAETGTRPPVQWGIARVLAPVLPPEVLQPWQPLLKALEEIAGAPPDRPKPLVQISSFVADASSPLADRLARTAAEAGPAAAMADLVHTTAEDGQAPTPGQREQLLSGLVREAPARWRQDSAAVLHCADGPGLRRAYLTAVRETLSADTPGPDVRAIAGAAFAVRAAADDDAGDALNAIIARWLREGGLHGLDLEATGAVAWLDDQVARWTTPRSGTDQDPFEEALRGAGGWALDTLITWGVSRASAGLEFPPVVEDRLEALASAGDDNAALAIIGFHLSGVHRVLPSWNTTHAATLYTGQSARAWLAWSGVVDPQLLARLDRDELLGALCGPQAQTAGAVGKTVHTLLDPGEPLGEPGTFLAALAARLDGPAAVTALLQRLAHALPPAQPDPALLERTTALWEAALDARLPATALTGAGAFARESVLPDNTWLELTARTMRQQPDLDRLDMVVARAAKHPNRVEALIIAAKAATVRDDTWHTARAHHHALELLRASTLTSDPAYTELKKTLIDAGHVEAAQN